MLTAAMARKSVKRFIMNSSYEFANCDREALWESLCMNICNNDFT